MLTKEEMCQKFAELYGHEYPLTIYFCLIAEMLDDVDDLQKLYRLLIETN